MGEQAETVQPETRTESHDPDHPEKLLEFMRTGWRDTDLDVSPVPQAPHYAKRRSAVAEAMNAIAMTARNSRASQSRLRLMVDAIDHT